MPASERITSREEVEHRPVPEFPGYRACGDGNIQSCWRRIGIGRAVMTDVWKTMKGDADRRGYRSVRLSRDGRTFKWFVHKLVLEAFVGPCPPGMFCRHLDGDNQNNVPTNLKWGTRAENEEDKRRHGTVYRGSGHHKSVLSEDDVRAIRRLRSEGRKIAEIASLFGVSDTAVSYIHSRKNWGHLSD